MFERRDSFTLENRGQKLFGIVHCPLVEGPVATVVMCHGFAGSKSGRYRHYVKLAESLSKKGVASVRFDFRGAGDSEGHLEDMSLADMVSDAQTVLEWTKEQPFCGPIGLLGRSMGGAIAVKAAAAFKGIRAISLWVPLFHTKKWQKLWKESQQKGADTSHVKELVHFNGQSPGDRFLSDFLRLDLTEDLAQLKDVPILHLHGENDVIIDPSHAEGYRQAASTMEMRNLEGADHHISDPKVQAVAIDWTTEWFQETLR